MALSESAERRQTSTAEIAIRVQVNWCISMCETKKKEEQSRGGGEEDSRGLVAVHLQADPPEALLAEEPVRLPQRFRCVLEQLHHDVQVVA